MLGLVAEHAAQWNAAWYGFPSTADELRTRLGNLHGALAAVERDPATLELTAGILVALDGATGDDIPERAMRGSISEIADGLAGYAALGISHLITHLFPRTPDAVRQLGEATALARERLGVAVG
jgi:hypothetical protein